MCSYHASIHILPDYFRCTSSFKARRSPWAPCGVDCDCCERTRSSDLCRAIELTSSTTSFDGTLAPLVLLPDKYSVSLEVTYCPRANDQHRYLKIVCRVSRKIGLGGGTDRMYYQNEAI
jgi:hypothetical protein